MDLDGFGLESFGVGWLVGWFACMAWNSKG